ncbi:type II secretion system protein GspC [Paraferrimonas sedimenticola]|uniref:Type II secretion system protein GspC n=1 Tax=Paraferrimonas sedimenticola TaxID=375674 RepID=A0AA37RVD0_9GAMM|nr:type II secretion system protein GspC [Paraferrimonas sedimenticola]GLP95926.1 type II secretion system protein GspC [Paraferrimonas sedimenticola]
MDWIETTFTRLKTVPQAPLANGTFVVLLVVALYLSARISWQLLDQPGTIPNWQPSVLPVSGSSTVQATNITEKQFFGKYVEGDSAANQAKQPEPGLDQALLDAPKTSLRILLTGVVASTQTTRGLAIIEHNGAQETYAIGDSIKGQSASIKEVFADRIIISNRGRYETLMLDGMEYTSEASSETKNLVEAKRQGDRTQVTVDRKALMQDPAKLTDLINITPVTRAGETLGYRLNPGKDPKLFKEAGFNANDLAKSINGYDLTDAIQAMEVMSQLAELTDVSVMVERDGQLVEINLSVPQ